MVWLVLEGSKACMGPREMKDFVASKVLEDQTDCRFVAWPVHQSLKRDPVKKLSNPEASRVSASLPRVLSKGMPGLPGEKGESGHVGLMVSVFYQSTTI